MSWWIPTKMVVFLTKLEISYHLIIILHDDVHFLQSQIVSYYGKYLTIKVSFLICFSQDLTLTNISDVVEVSYWYNVILTCCSQKLPTSHNLTLTEISYLGDRSYEYIVILTFRVRKYQYRCKKHTHNANKTGFIGNIRIRNPAHYLGLFRPPWPHWWHKHTLSSKVNPTP